MKNSALIPRKSPTMPKPQWHPPWKLYRVRRARGGIEGEREAGGGLFLKQQEKTLM